VVCAPTSGEYGTSVPLRKDVKCALLGETVVNDQPPCVSSRACWPSAIWSDGVHSVPLRPYDRRRA